MQIDARFSASAAPNVKKRERMRNAKFLLLLALMAAVIMLGFLTGCSSTTEEHIRAAQDEITFSRMVGRRAASGGFSLSKDSLVMRPSE